MLKTLREFRDDFQTASIALDGTISVTFKDKASEESAPASKPVAAKKERPLTAIEALSRKPPDFDFQEPS